MANRAIQAYAVNGWSAQQVKAEQADLVWRLTDASDGGFRVDQYSLMYYVCAISTKQWMEFLAGPYDTEDEAIVASGAHEADHPEHRTKTFVWTCRAGREYLIRQYHPATPSLATQQPEISWLSSAQARACRTDE